MKIRNSLLAWALFGWLASAGTASAAMSGTVARYNADAEGFVVSTIATVQIHSAAGGNPGGHVQIRKDLSTGFDIGTRNSTTPGFLGDYAAAGINGAGFDINVFNTTLDEAHIRFRRNVAENGWHYDFGGIAPNANLWESHDVSFDPTWPDATAMGMGWTQESGAPSFSALFASVGWIEVRTINPDGVSAIVGVDNVRVVPEPGVMTLLVAGLACLRRRATLS